MIAGIAISSEKLAVYKKHLDAAKLKYTVKPNFVEGVTMIEVECKDPREVAPAVAAAQLESNK